MYDDNSIDAKILHEFPDPSALDTTVDDIKLDSMYSAVAGANATVAGLQTTALQDAINSYAKQLNDAALKTNGIPVRTPSAQYKGFAAEEYFKQTLKINALAKGVPDWKIGVYTKGALPDGSNLSQIDMETDIAIFTRKNPWSCPERISNYQSKIHTNPNDYIKDMNNPQYQNVNFVGGAGQGVNDTVTVKVGNKTVSSDSITPADATELADSMKAQRVPEYQQKSAKQAELNQFKMGQAVKFGAITGAILSATKEIISIIKNRDALSSESFVKSIQNILCGTIEGGIRGGAIAGSVQILGKILGKNLSEGALGSVPAMAIANTSVDFAKDLYKMFVLQTIDADDLLCNTVNNTFTSLSGFGGAWAGAQIAGSCISIQTAAAAGATIGSALGPVGTVIGSAIGGIVIGIGAGCIVGAANKNAQKAFNECIADIQLKADLSGFEAAYYFADSMSSLSDFQMSFKNLLPCYNLISDLKEYNLRKKAIKDIHAKLDACLAGIDDAKATALKDLERQHNARIHTLTAFIQDQKHHMEDQFTDSLSTYIANSYTQYLETYSIRSVEISNLKTQLNENITQHNMLLEAIKNRNTVNQELNTMLDDLMKDDNSNYLVKSFLRYLRKEMSKDSLAVERQYISYSQALELQGDIPNEYLGQNHTA